MCCQWKKEDTIHGAPGPDSNRLAWPMLLCPLPLPYNILLPLLQFKLDRRSPNGKLARSSRPRRRARADRNQRRAAPPKRGNRRFESSPALYGSGGKHRWGASSRLVVRLLDEEAAQHSVLWASRTQQRR